jgi:hypothetical protein
MLPEFVIKNLFKYSQGKISTLLEKEVVNLGDFINVEYIGTSLLDPDFVYTRRIHTWRIAATLDTQDPDFIMINKAKIDNEELDHESVNNCLIEYLALQELKSCGLNL